MRKRTVLILVGVVAVAAIAAQWLPPSSSTPGRREASAQPRGDTAKGVREGPVASLPERSALPKPAGQPFRSQSWQPPAAKSVSGSSKEPTRPVAPYRVAGTVTYQAQPEIVLVKGNAVVIVREGDTLDDGYRVEAIGPDHVSLVYIPLGTVDRLPFAMDSVPAPSAAAGNSSPLPPLPSPPPLPALPPLKR